MKTKISIFILFTAICIAASVDPYVIPSATNYPASSTNTTVQTGLPVETKDKNNVWKIYCKLRGQSVATAGTAKFFFVESFDGTNYTAAAQSLLTVTVTLNGTNTVSSADWFYLTGVKKIALGRVEISPTEYVTNVVLNAVISQ